MNDQYRGLAWAHGVLAVQRLGAMLAPATFLLGGRLVSPLHVAPWANEPGMEDQPGVLRRLRGDWPCLPFGYTVPPDGFAPEWAKEFAPQPPGEEVHGHCSNYEWQWETSEPGTLRMSFEYPASNDVARVERQITPDPNAPAIDLEFRVTVRRDCRLPFGLHPCIRMPARPGAARLEPGRFDHGLTYPASVEPGRELFAASARFNDVSKVPGRGGKTVDASRLPFDADTEELLQLNGVDGSAAVVNEEEGYRVRLTWQKEHFPSLLLWLSNRGRKAKPWNGRHVALGLEPICSPFGLGVATAQAENPIAKSGTPTAFAFKKDTPFITRYRIAVEAV